MQSIEGSRADETTFLEKGRLGVSILLAWTNQAITRKETVMTLRNYEIVLVADANLTDDESGELFEKFKKSIADAGGGVKFESHWGRRRLAYAIRKNKHGIYRLFFAEANGKIIEDMKRQANYDEKLIKYFVISVDNLEEAYNNFEALQADPHKNATLVSETLGA